MGIVSSIRNIFFLGLTTKKHYSFDNCLAICTFYLVLAAQHGQAKNPKSFGLGLGAEGWEYMRVRKGLL